MSELFANSGQNANNMAVAAPFLDGDFVAGIDNPTATDGFGLVIPLGGGTTTRRYSDYGISSAEATSEQSQLSDLSSFVATGDNIVYNLEGLLGPQGEKGDKGDPGQIIIQNIGSTNYLTSIDEIVQEIINNWTTSDTIIYTSGSSVYWNSAWEKMSIDAAVKDWNASSIDEDGSFMIIAADEGVYVSTDTGETWNKKVPNSETFLDISCSDDNGKAIALGGTSKSDGSIWITSDYGVNWTEKTVSV